MKNFSGLTFTPPQTVRKLILTGCHSPLLHLNSSQNHFLIPLYFCILLLIEYYPPLSKPIFEFSDSLGKLSENSEVVLKFPTFELKSAIFISFQCCFDIIFGNLPPLLSVLDFVFLAFGQPPPYSVFYPSSKLLFRFFITQRIFSMLIVSFIWEPIMCSLTYFPTPPKKAS